MVDIFPLHAVLQRLLNRGGSAAKIPPCPVCGRPVKLGKEIRANAEMSRADVWLWCTGCPEAAVAFGVSPVPAWVRSYAVAPKEESGAGG